ncbi:alpha/beta hydrolase [Paucibacter sp. PLA-PC-4]|uniref:alpha/beta hydrolase n=1 Tax=Paucibacter sp. PLA-PC-4 TaxID=2993655 RepID=UPI00224A8CF5|nr:alpha/beta hydrolase [Paucibacter sp. PLA-PC-4]MCX2865204.1 alpha/beta hydrolase [Paucibacter sp. PLA-PC-4]
MADHAPEWFDTQYDNRARVADSAQILERWTRAAQLSREKSVCRLDLAYGPHASERLDLFPAQTEHSALAPVLVFIHGGYWRALDKADHSFLAPVFTDEGAMVVIPNYALCPGVSMEHIPLQLVQALAWVWRHAAEHGGDPNQIVLVGHSAGGHLAAMLACCDWKAVAPDLPRHLVKGVLSISGLHDLEPLRHAPSLQRDLRLDADAVRRLSPVNFPAPDETPVYCVVGAKESEEFKRQNGLLRQAWGARSVPICEDVPGLDHFSILHDLANPEGRSHQLARKLLELRWYSGLL